MRLMRVPKKPWLLILLATALIGGGWLIFGRDNIKKLDHPEYLTFSGSYVFSVPKDYAVDEQSIVGMQLVSKISAVGKTIEQVYEDNSITLQPITLLRDSKSDTFKKYVNETFIPGAKKVLSEDVSTTFTKVDGWDVARVTVKKDGQQVRFIYLKNGLHPVAVISKEETAALKTIEQSVTDVEKTDLKNEIAPLKKAVQNTAQLLRDKNAAELYKQAAPEFRSKNTQDDISKLLAVEEVFTQGSEVINGGSYANNEFGAVINFTPLNKDFKPAQGALYYQRINGQWKLKAMQLPNPAVYKIQS
ncbi:MAG: hypothetical protein AAB896_02325 [Patescibacteria group bacterium]